MNIFFIIKLNELDYKLNIFEKVTLNIEFREVFYYLMMWSL